MSWYLAPSLAKLREQVNELWPGRDKASDGSIGDDAHNARKSDHNADHDSGGVVRAIDIDVSDIDVNKLMAALKADDRTNYFIYDHHIYGADRFTKRAYKGANPHTQHIHVSIKHNKAAESGHAWNLGDKSNSSKPPVDKSTSDNTKADNVAIQDALKFMGIDVGESDGIDGPKMKAGVRRFQKAHGLVQDGHWGPTTQDKYEWNKKLQRALNAMKSTMRKLAVDGYVGIGTNNRMADVLRRNRWTRATLVANLKKVGAWK